MQYLPLIVTGALTASAAFAGGACKDKAEARHGARQIVHACLDAWAHDGRPTDPDPSDDCSAKVAAFVQAAKDVKACHVAAQGQKK